MIRKCNKPLDKILFAIIKLEEKGVNRPTPNEVSNYLLDEYSEDIPVRTIINVVNVLSKRKEKPLKIIDGKLIVLRPGKDHLSKILKKPLLSHPSDSPIPPHTQELLGKRFNTELKEFTIVENNDCGLCTSFILRKILEKLLVIVLSKSNLNAEIYENNYLKPLSTLIKIAENNKISGTPILSPRTSKKIAAIKFLGDTSAHNAFSNVDIHEVRNQLPYIIRAYDELAQRL